MLSKLINIFIDPIEKLHFEGSAHLVSKIAEHKLVNGIMELWHVRFIDKPECSYERYIFTRSI